MSAVQPRPRAGARMTVRVTMLIGVTVALASCSGGQPTALGRRPATVPVKPSRTTTTRPSRAPTPGARQTGPPGSPLPTPASLTPFGAPTVAGEGVWSPAGRMVGGVPAVYETTLVPPGGSQPAGIAWMDTRLLSALLYSGSKSPGGGPYRYTAPIQPAEAA